MWLMQVFPKDSVGPDESFMTACVMLHEVALPVHLYTVVIKSRRHYLPSGLHLLFPHVNVFSNHWGAVYLTWYDIDIIEHAHKKKILQKFKKKLSLIQSN